MRKIILVFLLLFTSSVLSLDTISTKFFPLKVGNRWTWYRTSYFYPGSGYETMKILNTININNHLYYISKYDAYFITGVLYYTTNYYYRIDSTTGNLYNYNTQNQTECLYDSLASRKNDSAYCSCFNSWYRCDTGSYTIFGQIRKKKTFTYYYFEGWGYRIYAANFGRVEVFGQAHQSQQTLNLRGCLINGILYGDTSLTGLNKISSEVPERFALYQNYPNPFNPTTHLRFEISEFSFVKLVVYDVLGKEIQTLVNEQLSLGTYEVDFDGSNLSSRVYYYTLTAENFTQTKRMVLIK